MSAYKELSSLTRKWKKHNSTIGLINQIDNDCQFGVEIECFKNEDYPRYLRPEALVELPSRWEKYWDETVSGEGYEFISPILRGRKGLLELKTVLTKLRHNGYRVDESCGGHTNISIRNRYVKSSKVGQLWQHKYSGIFLNCPGARDDHPYCFDSISYDSYDKCAKLVCKDGYYEFRLWRGTLDYRQWAAQIGLGYAFLKESLGDS